MPELNEQTIISGLSRLEALLVNDGPRIASTIGAVADTLAGPPSTSVAQGVAADPSSAHLGTRLHAFADMLQGLFNVIGDASERASAVVGTKA